MKLYILIVVLFCSGFPVFPAAGDEAPQNPPPIFLIDGEEWTLTREAEHCEHLVSTAVARYVEAPIYHPDRGAEGGRFLVNETSDCWIEVSVQGVDHDTFLYKVSRHKVILDQRTFTYRLPRIRAYPDRPNGL